MKASLVPLQTEPTVYPGAVRCTRVRELMNKVTCRQLPSLLTGPREAAVKVSRGEVKSDHLLHLSEGNEPNTV